MRWCSNLLKLLFFFSMMPYKISLNSSTDNFKSSKFFLPKTIFPTWITYNFAGSYRNYLNFSLTPKSHKYFPKTHMHIVERKLVQGVFWSHTYIYTIYKVEYTIKAGHTQSATQINCTTITPTMNKNPLQKRNSSKKIKWKTKF